MAIFTIQHEVQDFDTWKAFFDQAEPMRQSAGHSVKGVYRDYNNPNNVVIVFEAQNKDEVIGMMKDSGFAEKMNEAGVLGQARVWCADSYL